MSNYVGLSFGRYRITEQLGEGGMAIVYKAYDTRLERNVAIKVIRSDFSRAQDFLKRFEREAKALAQLTHPNIVHINDYGEYEDTPFLVMDYLPGGTLKEKLEQPMSFQEAVKILLPVASALEYAHDMKIIHRDVKPANILLTTSGQPMLTDFGLAKILEANDGFTLTGTGVGIGTPDYMAPEQWMGKTVPQTDIYALGIVLYEMITGRRPYSADTPAAVLLKQASEPLPAPSSFVQDIPENVERVLFKALAREPKNRFENMRAFADALEKLQRGIDTLEIDVPLPEETVMSGADKTIPGGALPSHKVETQAIPAADDAVPRKKKRLKPLGIIGGILLVAAVLFVVISLISGGEDGKEYQIVSPGEDEISPVGETSAEMVQPPPGFEKPPELKTVIFEEKFDSPEYDGIYNQEVWEFRTDSSIMGMQEQGVWHFVVPQYENGRSVLGHQQAWTVNELNFIEMKLQFDPYQDEDGFAEAFIMLDPGRKEWWIQCEMIIQQLEFRCLESNGGDSPTLFIEGVPVEPNTWHLFQMIIDPKTFEINV